MHPAFIYMVWAAQEWAWNVYPSTDVSSIVVVSSLAVQVLAGFWSKIEAADGDVKGRKRR